MKVDSQNFVALADIAINDGNVPQAVGNGTRIAYARRISAMYGTSYEHGEAMRQQAAEAKRRALRQLPDLLEQAEQTLTENGFTVLWAEDAEQARQLVLDIAKEHGTKSIAKSKSMATEEIALNDALITEGLDVIETDLEKVIANMQDYATLTQVLPRSGTGQNLTVVLQDKLLSRKRSIIETINDQLKNISQIEHSRHRSINNFFVNLIAGLIAYSYQEKKHSLNLTQQQTDSLHVVQ